MLEPLYYHVSSLAKRWGFTDGEIEDLVVESRKLRPGLRHSTLRRNYQLCLYETACHKFIPSDGVLELLFEDGSELADDEWYYLRYLGEAELEPEIAEGMVVIQSGGIPDIPSMITGERPLPTAPETYPVSFETVTGEKLAPRYVGELSTELGGEEIKLENFRVSRGMELIFTIAEVERFETLSREEKLGEAVTIEKPIPAEKINQEAVLQTIRTLGYDPECIPVYSPGRPGLKKLVRDELEKTWAGYTDAKFDKAWRLLRTSGEILDAN